MTDQEPATQSVDNAEVRDRWGVLLAEVSRQETRVVVEQNGVPVAAIISAADLDRLRAFERKRVLDFGVLDEFATAFADRDPDEIEREAAAALTQVRAENRQPAH